MSDVRIRDLGFFVPGGRVRPAPREPVAPDLPPQFEPPPAETGVLVTPPPQPAPRRAIFGSAPADGCDALGIDAELALLAELALHRDTRGPLCIGLVGGPGSGKSLTLARLLAKIRALAAAAEALRGDAAATSPFLRQVHIEAIDAGSLDVASFDGAAGGHPALALAARLQGGLRRTYPELAREVALAARDPRLALREANERLDEARRHLDAERRALDDTGSRRAALTDSVLYEASGSQIDAYARANRLSITSRLTGFGVAGDPVRGYKEQVQQVAMSRGAAGLALRSLWAFKGQTKLLVAAAILAAAGFGLGVAITGQASWLDALRGGPKPGPQLSDWFAAHMGLLDTLRPGCFVAAALALAANAARAFRFVGPIAKGARLLEADLEQRRTELDALYAHRMKRADALERDVERWSRAVADAEDRDPGAAGEPTGLPHEGPGAAQQAQALFAALSTAMAAGKFAAPQRVVLALDHMESLPPHRADALLDALHRAVGPGIVTLIAVDPGDLAADDRRRAAFERWIEVTLRLDGPAGRLAADALVEDALGRGRTRRLASAVDAGGSQLDSAVNEEEAGMLSALADLAGRTPRAMRRFVSQYLLARADGQQNRGLLAFMAALAQGGSAEERALVAAALAQDPAAPFDLPQADRRVRDALAAAAPPSRRVTNGEAADCARRAALFALVSPSGG